MSGTMTHLFERWNACEPNRCRFVRFAAMVKLGGIEREIAHSVTLLPVEHAVLLAAVIEAIEAREWAWSLHSYGGTVEAEVTVGSHDGEKFWIGGNGEHAYGLLLAYLAALDAEASQ